jgi:hypothetical protein
MASSSLLLPALMLVYVVGFAPASHSAPPEWEEVQSAIMRRRDAPQIRVTVEGVNVAAPGFCEHTNESVTYETSSQYLLDFEQGRFRLDQSEPLFSENGMVEGHSSYRFDGKQGAHLDLNQVKRPKIKSAALSDFDSTYMSQQISAALPLFWPYGVFVPSEFETGLMSDLSQNSCSWSSSGDTISLEMSYPLWVNRFDFDRTKDCMVVRAEFVPTPQPANAFAATEPTTWEVDVSRGERGWETRGWKFSTAGIIKSFRVIESAVVPGIAQSEFQVPNDFLQPDMLVSRDRTLHRVDEQGGLVPWHPGQPLEALPLLHRWTVIVGASALFLLFLFLARRFRLRH